ncbi:MAG: hypothetical protein RLO11_13145 [Salinisphaeraceae bacterium]
MLTKLKSFTVPIVSTILAGVVSATMSYHVSQSVSDRAFQQSQQENRIRSFEVTATAFDAQFQRYAHLVSQKEAVPDQVQEELLKLLTEQGSKLEAITREMPRLKREAEQLDEKLLSAQSAIASRDDFLEMKEVYESVGTMLVVRQDFLSKAVRALP